MKKALFFVFIVLIVGLCASTAFACMPPWWTAEDDLPEKMKNLYNGKEKSNAPNRFKQFIMRGYEPKV